VGGGIHTCGEYAIPTRAPYEARDGVITSTVLGKHTVGVGNCGMRCLALFSGGWCVVYNCEARGVVA